MSGAIPGVVILGKSTAPVRDEDPDADPPTGFAVFEGEKPVCLDCGGLLPGGGVELASMMLDFRLKWEASIGGGGEGRGEEEGPHPLTTGIETD